LFSFTEVIEYYCQPYYPLSQFMASLYVIPLLCLFLVFYLAGFEMQYKSGGASEYLPDKHLTLIEFLTQHKTKTKEYRRPPVEYGSYQHFIKGTLEGNSASFVYEYPLIQKIRGRSHIVMEPVETSRQADTFGMSRSVVEVTPEGFRIAPNVTSAQIQLHFNSNGWFYEDENNFGVAYHQLIHQYDSLTGKIAADLKEQLSAHNKDNYFNRVQAALNFIQFIPYGQPNFDSEEWYYYGLSLPPESFVLGYADCDSKSLFFASILSHLIPKENIVVVRCMVKSSHSRSNGAHAMAAVSDLQISGESILHNGKSYLLLETTAPSAIGSFDWVSFQLTEIRPLV
jgi:hypothetical protein